MEKKNLTSNPGPAFTLILPIYNEAGAVNETLQKVVKTLNAYPAEIIIVDDGSTDGTSEILRDFCVRHPQCRLLSHRSNRGYGAALKTGIQHARSDVIVIMDADGTYPVEAIDRLLVRFRQGFDMVVGARTVEHGTLPWLRRTVKYTLGLLARYVVGERIPDINSGFRIFHRNLALRFFDLLPDGFSFTTTLTLACISNGFLVDYIPIDYHPRKGQSKIRPIRDTLNFIQLILRIALYFAPMKIFLPISAVLFIIAVAWGFFTKWVYGHLYDDSTMMIAMTAVQVAVLALLAELINRRLGGYRNERHSGAHDNGNIEHTEKKHKKP